MIISWLEKIKQRFKKMKVPVLASVDLSSISNTVKFNEDFGPAAIKYI